jgi:hypothetical protein
MNFDACGANTAVLGNALSTTEANCHKSNYVVRVVKKFLPILEGTTTKNIYIKVIIFVKRERSYFKREKPLQKQKSLKLL